MPQIFDHEKNIVVSPPLTSGAIPATLIFLLYNAEDTVEALVEAACRQRHPRYRNQAEWLDVVFIDDCSADATITRLGIALAKAGSPLHFRIIANEKNLGLAGTLNKVFQLIKTPYGLTCHVDVVFGRDDYVAEMLALMESNPQAGAITGKPEIPAKGKISAAEKINIICNLMDVLPAEEGEDLVPVGFAEGRCDMFRVESLKKVGFWDTSLRASGEDQILAARMRQEGYELYQAPKLPYFLSVSTEQNSLAKLLKHAHLFGRTQPYILLTQNNAGSGITGANRKARTIFRLSHVLGTASYLLILPWLLFGLPAWIWLLPLSSTVCVKAYLFRKHLRLMRLAWNEWLLFVLFVPLQDICYATGLVQGVWNYVRVSRLSKERPIS